jgi:GNAT superfamily N-acetyltransferase
MISITHNIQLQDIKIEDQPKLMKLLEGIYPPAYRHLWINEDCSFYFNKFYNLDNLKLELADPNAAYYFVIYKSNLVGIFRFIFDESFKDFPDKKSTYLNRIYLSEAAQGKGVAKALFLWLESCVKQRGNTMIWLKAMDSQNQALRFYEKQGYNYGTITHLDFELIHSHLRGMNTLYKVIS